LEEYLTRMKETCQNVFSNWDGTHTGSLIGLYQDYHTQYKFWDFLVGAYLEQPEWEVPVTWLLKHHYDQKQELTDWQVQVLIGGFSNLEDWESRLHILQLVPKWTLTKEQASFLEPLLVVAMKDDKKFVRAAGFEAYAKIVPLLSDEARVSFLNRCQAAMATESASVKVKLRRALKQLS